MLDKIILLAYGLFLLVGGYFGFKKGSTVSLIMGVASGVMVFLGLWILTIKPNAAWIFLSCVTGFLTLIFLIRFVKTHTFMPSGMLLLISLLIFVFSLIHLR